MAIVQFLNGPKMDINIREAYKNSLFEHLPNSILYLQRNFAMEMPKWTQFNVFGIYIENFKWLEDEELNGCEILLRKCHLSVCSLVHFVYKCEIQIQKLTE